MIVEPAESIERSSNAVMNLEYVFYIYLMQKLYTFFIFIFYFIFFMHVLLRTHSPCKMKMNENSNELYDRMKTPETKKGVQKPLGNAGIVGLFFFFGEVDERKHNGSPWKELYSTDIYSQVMTT